MLTQEYQQTWQQTRWLGRLNNQQLAQVEKWVMFVWLDSAHCLNQERLQWKSFYMTLTVRRLYVCIAVFIECK